MREERTGRWLLVLAGSCATFTVVFGVVAWLIFHDRPGSTNSDVIAAVGIAAGLGAGVGALFGQPLFGQWLAEKRALSASSVPAALALLEDADRLAQAVKDQWTRAAAERTLLTPDPIPVQWVRSSLPVAGPVSAAVGSKKSTARFPPLPGLGMATVVRLRTGRLHDLHAVYGGLASGRLVIVGQPGSGKTGAAVLLVLAALAYREQVSAEDRPRVPVPVMLTLQGWDPARERFEAWLVARLAEIYPLFAGKRGAAKAGALLRAGKLAVILDGLDEIPKTLRPAALRALSEQAVFRVVILTRSAEMVAAASEAHFVDAAALELQDVDARVAADYLTRVRIDPAPTGWRELIDSLRDAPNSPIAKAFGGPLTLTLLRDTYRTNDDVRELFDVASRAANDGAAGRDIENHLLDRVLPAAYASRVGDSPSRYDRVKAEHALRYIATRMNQDDTRDLRWWRVPLWAPITPRIVVNALILGVPAGLIAGLITELVFGFLVGPLLGLVFGIVAAIAGSEPKQMGALRLRKIFRSENLEFTLWGGVSGGLMGGLAGGLAGALVGGLMFGFVAWPMVGLSDYIAENTTPLSPLASWRADRRVALTFGLGYGLVGGLAGLVFAGFVTGAGLVSGLVGGLVFGLGGGLLFGLLYSETWVASLGFLQLASRRHTPVRLIRFLEDARGRGILRTVGPVYQFRHARLQDRLGEHPPGTTIASLARSEAGLPGADSP